MTEMDLPYSINEGDSAFTDPRSTSNCGFPAGCGNAHYQVDFTLPERFDLLYVGGDGEQHRPVMVHRAMGSVGALSGS